MTIQLCPNDPEIPYAMIRKDIMRDQDLSYMELGLYIKTIGFLKGRNKTNFKEIEEKFGIRHLNTCLEKLSEKNYITIEGSDIWIN